MCIMRYFNLCSLVNFSLAENVCVVMLGIIECEPDVRPNILPFVFVWNDSIVIGAL